MPFQIAPLYDKMLKGMPLNIISYKKAIWKGIEGHLKGIVQKLEDSLVQGKRRQRIKYTLYHAKVSQNRRSVF